MEILDDLPHLFDFLIFLLLLVWMIMDRCNFYFREPPDEE